MKALVLPLLILVGSLVGVYFTLEQQRKLDLVQTEINSTQQENATVTNSVAAMTTERKRAEEKLAATTAVFFETTEKLRSAKGQAVTIRDQITGLEKFLADYDAQKKRFEETSAQVAKLAQQLGENFSIDNIEEFHNGMKATLDSRNSQVDELNELITGAEKSIVDNKQELARQVQREERRQTKINRSALEAVVTGVNQDWGFLVIGAGSNSGFAPRNTLLIERDGRMIAKVRPSSIEPTQTIAEINFDSLGPGVRIQPGDKVIFENPAAD